MIQSFGSRETAAIYDGHEVRGIPRSLQERARIKLHLLDKADDLTDLYEPPSNRLKKIQGHADWYEVRVNQRYRIYFRWEERDAHEVIFDDHL